MDSEIKRTPLQQKVLEQMRYYMNKAEYHRKRINEYNQMRAEGYHMDSAEYEDLHRHYAKEEVYLACANDMEQLLREQCSLCEQGIKHTHEHKEV